MSHSKLLPYIEALFAVIAWGASFIATKVALQDTSPITIVWLRFLICVLILGLVVALGMLLDAKPWQAAAAGLGIAVVLFALFNNLLNLPLPTGVLGFLG